MAMPRPASTLVLLLTLLPLAGCMGAPPAAGSPPLRFLNAQEGANAPGAEPHPFQGLAPRVYLQTGQGTIVIEVAREQVPGLASHFLDLSARGAYDGTNFHRLVANSFIQGGDPNSRTANRSSWGAGGFANPRPDEFHPQLRHDAPGTVSMATGRPDTVGQQFFITLEPLRSSDDRFPVVGYVVAGMDVVRSIAALPRVNNAADGQPVEPATIIRTTVVEPDRPAGAVRHSISVTAPVANRTIPLAVDSTAVLVVRNTGTTRANVTLTAAAPPGWNVTFNPPSIALGAGAGRAVIIQVTPPAGGGVGGLRVMAQSVEDPASFGTVVYNFRAMPLPPAPRHGQNASVDYATFFLDGRLVDTTRASVAGDATLVPMSSVYLPRATYRPYRFTLGQGVASGFTWLAERTPVGGDEAAWIPWTSGYTDSDRGKNPLLHRDVMFEMHTVATG